MIFVKYKIYFVIIKIKSIVKYSAKFFGCSISQSRQIAIAPSQETETRC
jgi:hypothetical protein